MNTTDPGPHTPRRADDRRPTAPEQQADALRRQRTLTHLVDPYDMRLEPQPEEPGYGHGV